MHCCCCATCDCRLFRKVLQDARRWADKAGSFQGAFAKYGTTRYDCSRVAEAVPPDPNASAANAADVGNGTAQLTDTLAAAGAASASARGPLSGLDKAIQLDPAMLPDFNCSTPQASHWIQLRGVDPAPRLECQAGHFLSSSGCCDPCPPNHYKQMPGNAPHCALCEKGMRGAEGPLGLGSTFCVSRG